MSPEKKRWAKPGVQLIDQSIFEHCDRDKLLEVRNLVQSALDLVERSGDAPDAAAPIRAALHEIDGELAE
jgi:hypothetical protein